MLISAIAYSRAHQRPYKDTEPFISIIIAHGHTFAWSHFGSMLIDVDRTTLKSTSWVTEEDILIDKEMTYLIIVSAHEHIIPEFI